MPEPAAPRLNPIPDLLDAMYSGLSTLAEGEVATYIPELAHADPAAFGIALATLDGHVYEAGATAERFTIQSVSKPFVYALALADRGLDDMITHVGVEPSGDAFNAIRLEPGTGRPPNPMVNAGAIITSAFVGGAGTEAKTERIRAGLSAFAGRELDFDERVYASEWETGDRNRALAYLMRNAGALTADVDETLQVYFRQCAVRVTARDLAVMAATLANSGVNPCSGERVVDIDTAVHVLTVMATCGMYDFAGEWLLRVGLPAKSGVSGGIVAALPAQFGIGLFSPLLDERSNSVRGIAACQELSARFGLHLMRPPTRETPAVYASGSARVIHSSAARSDGERVLLNREGDAIAIRRIQGDLGFAAADCIARGIADGAGDLRWVILDIDRATNLHPVAIRLLDTLATRIGEHGIVTVIADGAGRGLLKSPERQFSTFDDALAWCEAELLSSPRS